MVLNHPSKVIRADGVNDSETLNQVVQTLNHPCFDFVKVRGRHSDDASVCIDADFSHQLLLFRTSNHSHLFNNLECDERDVQS